MTTYRKAALVAAVAATMAFPAVASAASGAKKSSTRITVHKRLWHGYGYLPGYRPWVNNLDRYGRSIRTVHAEPRYLDLYTGRWNYSWGYPGFYRGQWNGGGFGPCWTSTPIGMMPTCGQ